MTAKTLINMRCAMRNLAYRISPMGLGISPSSTRKCINTNFLARPSTIINQNQLVANSTTRASYPDQAILYLQDKYRMLIDITFDYIDEFIDEFYSIPSIPIHENSQPFKHYNYYQLKMITTHNPINTLTLFHYSHKFHSKKQIYHKLKSQPIEIFFLTYFIVKLHLVSRRIIPNQINSSIVKYITGQNLFLKGYIHFVTRRKRNKICHSLNGNTALDAFIRQHYMITGDLPKYGHPQDCNCCFQIDHYDPLEFLFIERSLHHLGVMVGNTFNKTKDEMKKLKLHYHALINNEKKEKR